MKGSEFACPHILQLRAHGREPYIPLHRLPGDSGLDGYSATVDAHTSGTVLGRELSGELCMYA